MGSLLRRLADSDLRDLPDGFVEWFCARNHEPVMNLSEVIEEFKLYKKEMEATLVDYAT